MNFYGEYFRYYSHAQSGKRMTKIRFTMGKDMPSEQWLLIQAHGSKFRITHAMSLSNQVILLLISVKLSTKQWYGSLSPHSCGLLSFLTAWLFLICTVRLLLSKVFLILLQSLWAVTSVPWIEGREPGSSWSRSWPSVTVCKWDATGFKVAALGSPMKNTPSLERRLVSQLSRHT